MAKLERSDLVDVDHFPCGCLVTTLDRKVLFANQYFRDYLDLDPASLIDQTIKVLFSRASQLFCESFVIPTTMHHGRCTEVLLYLLNARGEQVPMLANVRCAPNGTLTWVFVEADNRNKLLQKLETTRYALEEQRDQLDQMSRTDSLTGVANRRELEAVLERMFKEADRFDHPVSVLMMDIDKFKSINDTYGHDAGDLVLCALAKVLQSVCRETDMVARLGGDEFVCVLHDTDLSGAQVLADRIMAAVSKSADGPCAYTVSIGISGRSRLSPARSGDVLKFADKALYDAKFGGRDRTAVQLPAYTH